jgi:hypothetical protein
VTIYLERYRNGEREQVWAELLALGAQVREEPLFSDALAVARETMTRARANVETLVARLNKLGYKFAFPEWVFVQPPTNTQRQIKKLERSIRGPIPLSIRVWWEIVGSVSLMGDHPVLAGYWGDLPHTFASNYERDIDLSDPLVVDPIEAVFDDWDDDDSITLVISPDANHKENVSGDTYSIDVPNAAIDAILDGEEHNITFVNYLRLSFRWGGFPGFEQSKNPPTELLNFLAADLLPI